MYECKYIHNGQSKSIVDSLKSSRAQNITNKCKFYLLFAIIALLIVQPPDTRLRNENEEINVEKGKKIS